MDAARATGRRMRRCAASAMMNYMTVFGPTWDALTLNDLAAFLQDAPTEPLEWEGKGEWNPGAIRAAVCGFANSHAGGYLLLGIKKSGAGWSLDGLKTPNSDPASDVTDLIANGGVTPFPTGLDVRAFDTGDGKHVAVVHVPPAATPPCLTKGTAYERVAGKTIPVEDPARLASLFERGDTSRRAGIEKAQRLVGRVQELAAVDPARPQFALALGSPGVPVDLTPILFTTGFDRVASECISRVLIDEPFGVRPPETRISASQFELVYRLIASDRRLGYGWVVCLHREGAVAVHWTMETGQASISGLVRGKGSPVANAWQCACDLLAALGIRGTSYLQMLVGSPFPPPGMVRVARDGASGPTENALADIERELRRANGEVIFEPVP